MSVNLVEQGARNTEKEAKRQEIREAIDKAVEEVRNGQFLSLRAAGYALGLSPQQLHRAMEEGKLKVREQHVVTPKRLEEFAVEYLTMTKSGKTKVRSK